MIFKLIILAVVGFVIYKLLGGKFPQITNNNQDRENYDEALIECTTCYTYATEKDSIISHGKYYCSKECLK
ncbi:MAG: PP0621 family protein [Sulfurovum sp.]